MLAESGAAAGAVSLIAGASVVAEVLPFLTAEEAQRLAEGCPIRDLPAGEILLADGEPGEFMAFVLSGKLAVKKPTIFPGRFILLAEIESGGMLGEGAAVCGESHAVTVTALADSRLLIISRKRIGQLLAEDQELALKLLARIIRVLHHRLQSADRRLAWVL